MIFGKNEQTASVHKHWVAGEIFGVEIPADAETLLSGGTDFLTKAFHASGALAAIRDIPDVVAAQGRIREVLYGNSDFISFAHWNANILVLLRNALHGDR